MTHERALSFGMLEPPDWATVVREFIEDYGEKIVVARNGLGSSQKRSSPTATSVEPPTKRVNSALRKVAMVTGAGSGIGQAVAVALVKDFPVVVLVGRRQDSLEDTKKKCQSVGGEGVVMTGDVSSPIDVERIFTAVREQYGRLDLLFNNAGVNAPQVNLDEVQYADWKRVVDINLTGSFLCMQQAFRIMKAQSPQGGRIINNGSVSAQVPRPHAAPYNATKHAVSGLTKTGSLDGRGKNIAVGQIDIGNAVTNMSAQMSSSAGALQADGQKRQEPRMDVDNVVQSVLCMARLPLDANIQQMTVMATEMPLVGRG